MPGSQGEEGIAGPKGGKGEAGFDGIQGARGFRVNANCLNITPIHLTLRIYVNLPANNRINKTTRRIICPCPSPSLNICAGFDWYWWCHYTKSNPIDDHSNISSKTLQKQNCKPLGHYTCMQCGTFYLQTVQENILSHIILATYRKFTVATVRFTQNVSCNIFTHPIYQQVANVTV